MVESQLPPGFRQPLAYTGEGKGGPSPYEEDVVSSRQHFLSYLILISPIPPQLPLKIQRIFGYTYYIYVNMTIPHQPKQVKSMWYYVFWSAATVSVVLGQIYVASGYKELASALTKTLWSIN